MVFLEKVDPCLLSGPYVGSGWVENKLGTVKPVKVVRSGLVMIFGVSSAQRERALCDTCIGTKPVTCFAFRSKEPLKE